MTACALAVDPNSGLVAVGEFKGRGSCRIQLIDPGTGRVARSFVFTTAVFTDAQDGTRALAFSPDGTRLFAGTRYARVLRFDLTKPDKTPAKEWKGKGGSVDKLAVGADGKTVYVLATSEPTMQRWDADTGAPGAPLAPDAGGFRTFALLPSGELLANTGGHQYFFGADRARPAKLTDVDAQRVVSATGALVLAGDGPNLAIRDRDTGIVTDRLADPALRLAAHEEYLKDIALHPTGAFAATASGDTDRAVKVWELASGRLVGTVLARGTDPIRLAWSADGKYLLVTAAGHVARWEFVPGQRFACLSARALAAMTPLPDGRVAAISADINGRRDVFLGPLDAPAACTFFQEVGGNGRPGMSADPAGVLAVTESGPGIYHWKPGTVPPPRGFTEAIAWCPHFSPDGQTLWALVDAKEVRAFDPATGKTRGKWRNGLAEFVSGLASLDALAVGRPAAVVGGRDGTVYVFDPVTCQPITLYRTESDPVHAVGVTPDGALVVAGTQGGKLRTIRPADRAELPAVSAHPGGVTALAVSADGALLVTGGRDRAVRFWRRAGDRFEPVFAVTDLPGAARDLRFDAAGTRLLVLLGH
ncbi:MAG: hypothetical protein FJ304_21585 [Planctomycetes bacterium]|nr:hypothetical protein [Planctomycetota bacterium]